MKYMARWRGAIHRTAALFAQASPSQLRKVALAWLVLVGLLAAYWWQLTQSHQRALQEVQDNARLRASQTAQALTYQTESVLRKFNFIVQHLGEHWRGHDEDELRRVIAIALESVPPGAILQVLIADAQGQVVFSNLHPPGKVLGAVSVADQPFFRAHAVRSQPGMFIGTPGKQRIFGQWSVELSRSFLRDGALDYVVAVSISVAHLAQAFQQVFPNPQDVVMLLDNEGNYITRSHGLDQAMGRRVPVEREYLHDLHKQAGSYEAHAAPDGILRYYAWQRVPGFPLVLSLGLGHDKVIAPLNNSLRASRWQNLASSVLLLLATWRITLLVLARARQQRKLLHTQQRLQQTLQAVRDGLWSWDVDSDHLQWDALCHDIAGWPQGQLPTCFAAWCELLHPDDRARVQQALQGYRQHPLGAQSAARTPLRLECRVQGSDQRWHWVELRGQMGSLDLPTEPRAFDPPRRHFMGTCSDISERVAAAQLRHALLERSTAAIVVTTPQRIILQANHRAQEIFAPPATSLVGQHARILHLDEAYACAIEAHYQQLRDEGQTRLEYPLVDATGAMRWFDMQALLRQPGDPESDVVWTMTDVTDRHQAVQALQAQHLRMVTLLEQFQAAVLLEDAQGCIVTANTALCHLLALDVAPQELQGASHAGLLQQLSPQRAAWLALPQQQQRHSLELADEERGRYLWLQWLPIVHGAQPLGQIWLLHDITERKHKEQELATLASTDALTGLPNRRSFMAMLEQYQESANETIAAGAVLVLDVDHFKRVNDTWGHPVGDLVLQSIAQQMRAHLRTCDYAGRLGGEEFAVLVRHATLDEARQLAERIRHAVASHRTPLGAHGAPGAEPIAVTISIGLASLAGADCLTALAEADKALYQAKNTGRNRVCIAPSSTPGV